MKKTILRVLLWSISVITYWILISLAGIEIAIESGETPRFILFCAVLAALHNILQQVGDFLLRRFTRIEDGLQKSNGIIYFLSKGGINLLLVLITILYMGFTNESALLLRAFALGGTAVGLDTLLDIDGRIFNKLNRRKA